MSRHNSTLHLERAGGADAARTSRVLWIFGLVGGGLLVSSVAEYIGRFVMRAN